MCVYFLQENPSSDSFYDSDNAEQDQPMSESSPAPKQPEPPVDEFTADSDEDDGNFADNNGLLLS